MKYLVILFLVAACSKPGPGPGPAPKTEFHLVGEHITIHGKVSDPSKVNMDVAEQLFMMDVEEL